MARRVFFSFHFQRDIWRVNQIRNHGVFTKKHDIVPFYDASLWEESQKKGAEALRKLINANLEKASVTCVLIGAETATRPWVLYEIAESLRRGKAVFGVRIHAVKDEKGQFDTKGLNPFTRLYEIKDGLLWKRHPFSFQRIQRGGKPLEETNYTSFHFIMRNQKPLSRRIPVFDWVEENGYQNFGTWIENSYPNNSKFKT